MASGALESNVGEQFTVAGTVIGTRRLRPRQLGRVLLAILLLAASSAALADFRICNSTQGRVGIAVGYKDGDVWMTEGWWNLQANTCETLIRGPLVARFYYLYAVDYDQGGEWSGKAFMCTRDREFTIRGLQDCLARGFNRTGFFEVDTGEQRNWTVQLTEQNQIPPPAARPGQSQNKSGTGGR